MNEKRKLSYEKLSKVNGGFKIPPDVSLSHKIEPQHMDPNKTYSFTCKKCNIIFPKSGVGDNTAVFCPKCYRNVR